MRLRQAQEIFERLDWVLSLNHDDIENCSQPQVIDQIDEKDPGLRPFHKQLMGNIRPAEHAVVAIYQEAMKEYFSNPHNFDYAVRNTVGYIDLIKLAIKDNMAFAPAEREELSAFMLNRYMSPFLYNTPVREFNRKVEVNGQLRSIADAMEDFGVNAIVKAPELEALCRRLGIIEGPKSYPSADHLRKVIGNALSEDLLDEGYNYYVAKQVYESIKDKTFDEEDNIVVTGVDAMYCNLALNASAEYDFAHFWAHQYTKIPFIPPRYKGHGSTLDKDSVAMNETLHRKLGSRSEIRLYEAGVVYNKLWETFTDQPFFIGPNVKEGFGKMMAYLTTQAPAEIRGYFLPKVQKLVELQQSREAKQLGGMSEEILKILQKGSSAMPRNR